jgi:hypothetical protein
MSDAYKYVDLNHGIDTETSYPYTAGVWGDDEMCHFKATNM